MGPPVPDRRRGIKSARGPSPACARSLSGGHGEGRRAPRDQPPDIADRRRRRSWGCSSPGNSGRGPISRICARPRARPCSTPSSRSAATGGSRWRCRRPRSGRASGPACRRSSPTSSARTGGPSRSSRRRSARSTPTGCWPRRRRTTAVCPASCRASDRWAARDYATRNALMLTAGSTSVRAFEPLLREAGAGARALLQQAAAARWGVDWEELDTRAGFVWGPAGRIAFAELAEAAAGLDAARASAGARRQREQADRPAAAEARPAGQDRRLGAVRRRRPASRHGLCGGAQRPGGEPARRDRRRGGAARARAC